MYEEETVASKAPTDSVRLAWPRRCMAQRQEVAKGIFRVSGTATGFFTPAS
jgi:hypothetical protein